VLSGGRLGFVLLGVWFALLGLTGPAVARWGERTRPLAPPAETAAEIAAMPGITAAEAAETIVQQATLAD
jgi:hypothetical protein